MPIAIDDQQLILTSGVINSGDSCNTHASQPDGGTGQMAIRLCLTSL